MIGTIGGRIGIGRIIEKLGFSDTLLIITIIGIIISGIVLLNTVIDKKYFHKIFDEENDQDQCMEEEK